MITKNHYTNVVCDHELAQGQATRADFCLSSESPSDCCWLGLMSDQKEDDNNGCGGKLRRIIKC